MKNIIQSALVITYRLGVVKVNTFYFLRYFDIAYFKVVPKKRNSKVEFHWNLQVKNGIGIYLKSGIVHFNT